jgi:uncharacterized tellurite resistance protein B-like protein
MFSKILDFLQGKTSLELDSSGDPTEKDLQIATAVLLLEVAGSDEDYAPEEVKACVTVMNRQFNSDDEETMEILAAAEELRSKAGRIDEFVEAVNENFTEKQRQLILAMAWKVILADQQIENHEQKFASQLRTRLKLTREQAQEAKDLAFKGAL